MTLRQFEHYTLLGTIEEGGMGVVYQAVHRGLNRSCALKVIRTGLLASPEERRRFLTEAEATAQLDHPCIVRVARAAEFEGHWFLEMELVEGGTLADRIAEGPLPPNDAAQLVERLARAVQHAHERGVLHRDLKPANVLLTPDGQPKLADFGLARFLDKERELTRTIAVLGTPAYLAPELASGRAGDATIRADVYGLGVILFECLTGQRPFHGQTSLEILRNIQELPIPRPSSLRRGLPRDLETICLKCLEKESACRYDSAAALADDLAHWRQGEPIAARPAGLAEQAIKWMRRHPLKVALVTAILMAIAGPMLVATWYIIRELPYRATVHTIIDDDLHGIFKLEIYDAKGDRCTLNFTRNHFADERKLQLLFTNVPPDWLSRLSVQIHADQAGRPDPPRSPVLTNGQTFRLKVGSFFDRAFYCTEVGWAASNLLVIAPEAKILLLPSTNAPLNK